VTQSLASGAGIHVEAANPIGTYSTIAALEKAGILALFYIIIPHPKINHKAVTVTSLIDRPAIRISLRSWFLSGIPWLYGWDLTWDRRDRIGRADGQTVSRTAVRRPNVGICPDAMPWFRGFAGRCMVADGLDLISAMHDGKAYLLVSCCGSETPILYSHRLNAGTRASVRPWGPIYTVY
jgi:hypothetical protein